MWYRPAIPGKPTVMLVHGLTGTSRWWSPVIARLPEEVGVIAPDLRGRGQSWETPGPYGLTAMAADFSACLNHFEVPAATIAGYSMGAWLAGIFGSTRPRRVNGVVLVDGGLRVDLDPDENPDTVLSEFMGPSLARLDMDFESEEAYLDFWKQHPALIGRWTTQMDRIFAYEIDQVRGDKYRCRANPRAVIEGGNDMLFDEEAAKAVYELVVPTRALIVDHDLADRRGGFMSEDAAAETASRNPNVVVERLRDLNHFTLILGSGATNVASAIVRML